MGQREHRRMIPLCALLLLAAALWGCGAKRIEVPDGQPANGPSVVRTARTQLGVPYKWGGSSPETGFDCSGYICWVYARHGITVPRHTSAQAKAGRPVSRKQLKPGDILVFRQPGKKGVAHTGIYAGKGTFLHSPKSGAKVREEALAGVWSKWFLGGRRVLP